MHCAYLDLEVEKDEEGAAAYTGDPRLSALYTCTVELAELYTGDTASVSADAGAARSDDLNIKSELLCHESHDHASIDLHVLCRSTDYLNSSSKSRTSRTLQG